MKRLLALVLVAFAGLSTGCRPAADTSHPALRSNNRSTENPASAPLPGLDPCAVVLASHSGGSQVDQNIRRLQQEIPTTHQPEPALERLGWLFVTKARSDFDPGFYKMAEQCALCMEAKVPGNASALLLKGHVLQSLHRFREAEPLAQKLVATRGLPADYGLLGDVLMEQGRLAEAVGAYQQMVDLKPDSQAYARIAHLRWLKGDLAGAIQVMELAAGATTPHAAEAAAWIFTRLGGYQFLAGDTNAAWQSYESAVVLQKDYPPARLLQGRLLLAAGDPELAIEPLRQAGRLNPLPEYLWTLAETLRAAGHDSEAREVETQLRRTGAANDPRTFALFLATTREQPAIALELAQRELRERADIHTHDALAWSLAGAGRWKEALVESRIAVAEGTVDPRLQLHAGLISLHLGDRQAAQLYLATASQTRQSLLPSERTALNNGLASLGLKGQSDPSPMAAAKAVEASVP